MPHSSLIYVANNMASDIFVWTPRRLRAAYWVGRVLGVEGEIRDVAHTSWIDLPFGSDITFEELASAEDALISAGLIRLESASMFPDPTFFSVCELSESEYPLLLLGLLLETQSPLWLKVAFGDGTQFSPELVPEEMARLLEEYLPDAEQREVYLLARGRVVSNKELEEIGAKAEEKVVSACQEQLIELGAIDAAAKVIRVSLISDELGYDVTAPRVVGGVRRLEVKGTRSQSSTIAVFISRNEYETGMRDSDWSLVVVRIGANIEEIVGWATAQEIQPLVPEDQHDQGRWQSAKIRLDATTLNPYLPSPN